MRKNILHLIAACLLLLWASAGNAQTIGNKFQDGKIYLKIADDAVWNFESENGEVQLERAGVISPFIEPYKITRIHCPFHNIPDKGLRNTWLIEFGESSAADMLIAALSAVPGVEYTEKVPVFRLFLTPNDTYYGTVSGLFGSANAKWHLDRIRADSAWDLNHGSSLVTVAVLDNAIWTAHPDLSTKIVQAWDVADNDPDPNPPTADLTWSHGTHTSGLVGAKTNNGIGVASIGYDVSLMAVKVARNSDGALVAGYEGIIWAADHGADVISMSWGTTQYFQTMQNIINYAYNKGCVMVAAAGNDGNDTIQYPAGLNHVISVASTDGSDQMSSFSCYGPWIDVCAPGGFPSGGAGLFSVLSTTCSDASFFGAGAYGVSGKYDVMQGTSMSCPIVAGLCGLMLSADSTLTPEKLENLLKISCDNIDAQNPGHIGDLGSGRINAFKAVKTVQDSARTLVADFMVSENIILVGSSVDFTDLSAGSPVSWQWSFPGGIPSASTSQNPTGIVYSSPGIFPVTLTVGDGTTNNTEIKNAFIMVRKLPSSVWIPQATGFVTQYRGIRNISIVNPQVAWASAYDGSGAGATVLEFTRSWDGGATWTPGTIQGLPTGMDLSELFAINRDTAWAALWGNTSGGKGIFKTTDGGMNWTAQPSAAFSGSAAFPNTVYFWDDNNGVCLGDPNGGYFEFYTTSDGGNNWTRVPQSNIPAPASGEYGYNGGKDYAVVGNTIWFGTNKGNVFKSTDRGLNWTSAPAGCAEVSNIAFTDENNGLLEYKAFNQTTGQLTAFQLKKTSDGGLTWQNVNFSGDLFKSDIDAVPGKTGMYVATGSFQDLNMCGSSYSLDYGQNWTMIDDSVQYTCVRFYDLNTGWAGGFNQSQSSEGIWKWMGLIQDSVNIIPEFIADKTQINVGDTVNFTDLSLGTIQNYAWTFGGGQPSASAAQHPAEIIYNTAGDYTVTLVCSNSDTSASRVKTAYIHVSQGGSVSDNVNVLQFEIFPNPASGYFNIQCSTVAGYWVTDLHGKTLLKGLTVEGENRIESSLLSAGCYFVKLIHPNGISSQKLIIK